MRPQNQLTKFKPKKHFKVTAIALDMAEFQLSRLLEIELYAATLLASLPIPETVKTPLIWICGRPWWIWCDRIDDAKPIKFVWVEDRLT